MIETSCQEWVKKLNELDLKPIKNITEWAGRCSARGFLLIHQLNSKHDYKFVQKTPYIYKHECVHCGRKKEWWN